MALLVSDDEAVGDLGILHRRAAQKDEQIEELLVLVDAREALARWVPQLNLLGEDREVRLLQKDHGVCAWQEGATAE